MRIADDVQRYLERLVGRLTGVLGDRLIGVYGLGGLAFDDYRPESSDLDVYAVVQGPLGEAEKLSVAERCSHRALPCPARKLELVLICAASARRPGSAPHWELNFNTGARQTDHVGVDPAAEPSHWFVIDLAIAHERGVALLGPSARELIGRPDAEAVAGAQSEVVAWCVRNGTGADTVTAACRAWHWRQTGTFAAKREAVEWAVARLGVTTGPS